MATEVWENQRKYFGRWSAKLLPTDRAPWSSRDGKATFNTKGGVEHYRGWKWVDEWRVDMTSMPADKDGWQYAVDFSGPGGSFSDSSGVFKSVRRRRWMRTQEGPRSTLEMY